MVISPYQDAFTLLRSDIVDKLMNSNYSYSNLAYELHCTVQQIESNLQQTTLDNEKLLNEVTIHVNDLMKTILQLENETRENEMLMNELNNTIETAREQVRIHEKAEAMARRHFSQVVDALQNFKSRKSNLFDDSKSRSIFERHNHRNPFSHHTDFRLAFRCHIGISNDPWYQSSAKAMHNASDQLKKQKQHLKDHIDKYNITQSKIKNSSQQLIELNTTLQQQQIIKSVTDALNKHFQLINNRLKMGSNSSKRLLDVLMYVLDYETIVKSLNSIYETLFNQNIIESTDFKLSKETMDKVRQKVLLMSAKLPQIRYRRKLFHQPCAYH